MYKRLNTPVANTHMDIEVNQLITLIDKAIDRFRPNVVAKLCVIIEDTLKNKTRHYVSELVYVL